MTRCANPFLSLRPACPLSKRIDPLADWIDEQRSALHMHVGRLRRGQSTRCGTARRHRLHATRTSSGAGDACQRRARRQRTRCGPCGAPSSPAAPRAAIGTRTRPAPAYSLTLHVRVRDFVRD